MSHFNMKIVKKLRKSKSFTTLLVKKAFCLTIIIIITREFFLSNSKTCLQAGLASIKSSRLSSGQKLTLKRDFLAAEYCSLLGCLRSMKLNCFIPTFSTLKSEKFPVSLQNYFFPPYVKTNNQNSLLFIISQSFLSIHICFYPLLLIIVLLIVIIRDMFEVVTSL